MIKRRMYLGNGMERLEIRHILAVTGLASAPAEVYSSYGYLQDGVMFGDIRLTERPVMIQYDVQDDPEGCKRYVRQLARLFGKGTVSLEIEETDSYTGRKSLYYLSPCRMEAPFEPERQGLSIRTIALQLTAGDPYIKRQVPAVNMSEEDAKKVYKNDYLWYAFDALTLSENRLSVVVDNEGDMDTPCQIRFFGPADQPFVQNVTTGEKIGVNQVLAVGEYMDIDTEYGRKKITITRADGKSYNAFHYILEGCVFPMLHPGRNELNYGSASGETGGTAMMEIRYYERYAGYEY